MIDAHSVKCQNQLSPEKKSVCHCLTSIGNFDQWPKLHLGLDALSNQKKVETVSCILYRIQFTTYVIHSYLDTLA